MTLNQVINRLQSLAENHKQVRSFYYGDIAEFLANGEVKYPACFVQLVNSNVSIADNLTHHNFQIFFCGLLNISEGARENFAELQSDLTSIAEDMIAMINAPAFYGDWTINQEYSLSTSAEKFEDYVMAVDFTIDIAVNYTADRCQVPLYNPLPDEEDTDIMIIRNNIYEADGSEGQNITVAALVNKEILMQFLGDKLVTKVDADPTPNQYTYDASTGTLGFGVELQPEQILQTLYKTLG